MPKLRLLGVVFLAVVPALAPPHPISELEAIHLVERRVTGIATKSVETSTEGYLVNGTVGEDSYQALVDARVGRVLRITKNGSPFYQWPGITVISHRGATPFAPENTLAAFRKAVEMGADLVEMDVRETTDGHLVIMHDVTVDRTTNGMGRVSDLTLAEIQKLDAGSWFDRKFAGERVPTLEEALDSLAGQALPDIDFKAGTPEKLVAALDKFRLAGASHAVLR